MTQTTAQLHALLTQNVGKTVVGREEAVTMLLAAMLCGGHALLEDVPGTGKTLLARSFAHSLGCTFRRVQFTPDLLPADITGSNIFDPAKTAFRFVPGPVFTQVLLADELNRATPRTQAGLLECMEELQTTVDGRTYELSTPFFVIATQNPVESLGTFPLPEAQLDRFLVRIRSGYPTHEQANMLLKMQGKQLAEAQAVTTPEAIEAARKETEAVYICDDLIDYCNCVCEVTRGHQDVALGASPRAALHLLRLSKALAALSGRNFVLPDDIKRAVVPVLAHRLVLKEYLRIRGDEADALLGEILAAVPVPTEAVFEG